MIRTVGAIAKETVRKQALARGSQEKNAHKFGEDYRPKTSEMLIPDTTEENSKAKVDLRDNNGSASAKAEERKTYLCMNHIAHTRTQEVDKLLLDDRQLCEESIPFASVERVGEASQTERS